MSVFVSFKSPAGRKFGKFFKNYLSADKAVKGIEKKTKWAATSLVSGSSSKAVKQAFNSIKGSRKFKKR